MLSEKVVDLNLFGTVLPTMAFVDVMAKNKKGVIVNFCSESALRPLTRVVGYGSAKAAKANYTVIWLRNWPLNSVLSFV